MKYAATFGSLMIAVGAVTASFGPTVQAAAPKDLKDKVILANPDKYAATLRFGKTQRKIDPRKASLLSPRSYPLTLEYWTGNTRAGWVTTQIPSAGVYDFRWHGGQWSLTRRQARTTPSTTVRRPPTTSTPSHRRSTGSYQRTVRGPTYTQRGPTYVNRGPTYVRGWTGSRWPLWVRGVWGIGKLYQFVRDEEDRDLIRDIIIGREIDDTVRREIEDRLRDDLIAVPYAERRELERAIDDISGLDPDDWKDITTLPTDDWDRLRDEIGDDISDADWDGLGGYIDTMDERIDDDISLDDINLDDVGIDTMDWDVDLGDLDENLDLGDLGGDFGLDMEDIDLGDITGNIDTMDLSDFDDAGFDAGGMDDAGDFDLDVGGYDAGGFDDWGGGLDDGGFDDFGGGFDDFGGGDFFDF